MKKRFDLQLFAEGDPAPATTDLATTDPASEPHQPQS
jgi:hypothetical protein